jgi:protein AATF/BFR2
MSNLYMKLDDTLALGMRWAALKQQTKKVKKKVDTKASKGRKLRYHVHEKLQNFMVPVPAGYWHQDMIDELYASLLGQSNTESDVVKGSQTSDAVSDLSIGQLKIFG